MKKTGLLLIMIIVVLVSACGRNSASDTDRVITTEENTQEQDTTSKDTTSKDTTSLDMTSQNTTSPNTTVKDTTEQSTTCKNMEEQVTTGHVVTLEQKNAISGENEKTNGLINLMEYNEEYILQKMEELKKIYKQGMYWNNGGVTTTPCNHEKNKYIECNVYIGVINNVFTYEVSGRQCLGFASMCSDYIFGINAPTNVFHDYESLAIGDFVRTDNDYHSALVLSKNDEYITIVECNGDYNSCVIWWGRKITKEYLEKTNSWYIKRY